MLKISKEDKEYYAWIEEQGYIPILRGQSLYTYFESIQENDLYECIKFEAVKRQLIPVDNLKDYEHITFNNYKKIEEPFTSLDIDEAFIYQDEEKQKELIKKQYHFKIYKQLKLITTIPATKLKTFQNIFRDNTRIRKTKQQKIGDFFFIWDYINKGFPDRLIIECIQRYHFNKENTYSKPLFSNKTFQTYKKQIIDIEYDSRLKKKINKGIYREPTQQTLELFEYFYVYCSPIHKS